VVAGSAILWSEFHIAALWRRGRVPVAAADDSPKPLSQEAVTIQQAQAGDRQAFAVLVEHYWDRLYRWLYHLTHHQHTAEDLAQETFMKAFARLDTFRAGSNFQAWIFRIAYNAFLNQRRVAARSRQSLPEEVADNEAGPDELALSREAMQLLARAIGRLPGEFRAALLLRSEQGLSFREIADVLDTTEQTARWRVFKARQKLMTVLAPQLDQEKS
jgi:RNA polymerase sigma-70 factor (ECF subfamily)